MHELKREIYKSGMNISKLAKIAGVDRVTLQHFFSGKTKALRGDTIALLSKALNKNYEDLERLCTNDRA